MRNKRAAIAAAPLSLALLLAACGSDDDSADTTDTTTTTTEATTASSETTAPPASETTAPPSSGETTAPPDTGARPGDTEAWAVELVRAWGAGERDRAAELATAEVVDTLFEHADPGGGDWVLDRCEGAAGSAYCTFSQASTGASLVTHQANMPDEGTGQLPPVDSAELSGGGEVDEETLGAQSDPLVRAWGTGDREEATTYAHPDVVEQLFGIYDPGGPDWDRRDCISGRPDGPQCIYYDPNRDERLIVSFDGTALPTDAVITGVELREGASG